MSVLADIANAATSFDIGPELGQTLETLVLAWLLVRTETVNKRAKEARDETKPNGGASLRDALDAIHRRLDAQGFPTAPVERSRRDR